MSDADLQIGKLAWGDSGLYYCVITTPDDLEGKNEDSVELLVLGKRQPSVRAPTPGGLLGRPSAGWVLPAQANRRSRAPVRTGLSFCYLVSWRPGPPFQHGPSVPSAFRGFYPFFLSLFALAPLTLISICSKLYLSLYMLIVEENAIVSSRSSVETTERKDFPGESGSPESPEPSIHHLRHVLAGGAPKKKRCRWREAGTRWCPPGRQLSRNLEASELFSKRTYPIRTNFFINENSLLLALFPLSFTGGMSARDGLPV